MLFHHQTDQKYSRHNRWNFAKVLIKKGKVSAELSGKSQQIHLMVAARVFFFFTYFFLRMLAITNFNLADEDVLAQHEEVGKMNSRVFHKDT